MLNLFSYLLGRLRGVVGERRRAPRYDARLLFSVSVLLGRGAPQGGQTLVGRTHNLSETGLALVVPSLSLGADRLNDTDSTLRLMLDLPSGSVEIHVMPVRSHQLGEKDKDTGYFIGAKIIYMSDEARARFMGFLRSLRSRRSEKAVEGGE